MKVLKESQGGQQAAVTAEDLALINLLSRKELKEEDVYVFSLRLCDNEVDRDQERFAPPDPGGALPAVCGQERHL